MFQCQADTLTDRQSSRRLTPKLTAGRLPLAAYMIGHQASADHRLTVREMPSLPGKNNSRNSLHSSKAGEEGPLLVTPRGSCVPRVPFFCCRDTFQLILSCLPCQLLFKTSANRILPGLLTSKPGTKCLIQLLGKKP